MCISSLKRTGGIRLLRKYIFFVLPVFQHNLPFANADILVQRSISEG